MTNPSGATETAKANRARAKDRVTVVYARERIEQCGLAGAVGTLDYHMFTRLDIEMQRHGDCRAIAFECITSNSDRERLGVCIMAQRQRNWVNEGLVEASQDGSTDSPDSQRIDRGVDQFGCGDEQQPIFDEECGSGVKRAFDPISCPFDETEAQASEHATHVGDDVAKPLGLVLDVFKDKFAQLAVDSDCRIEEQHAE